MKSLKTEISLTTEPQTIIERGPTVSVPSIIMRAGNSAMTRYLEFFAVTISNKNTRVAYITACRKFFTFCETYGILDLLDIEPIHVATYVEVMKKKHATPTVKQNLAAIRKMFDWLVTGQIISINPAHSARGPALSTKKGKTPVLTQDEARRLLDSIELKNEVAYRDRALIAFMMFSLARVSAALNCELKDFVQRGDAWWLILKEKGGKRHEMPVHSKLAKYLLEYIEYVNLHARQAEINAYNREHKDDEDFERKYCYLFTASKGRAGVLTERQFNRSRAWEMVQRRASAAGIAHRVNNHSFRATGITAYLQAGGSLEKAQEMANHSSPRTTKLYDRTNDAVTIEQVEMISI